MRKSIEMTIRGTSPLLLNSNKGVNPLHPLTKKMKILTKARNKTEEQDTEILHLKSLLGMYGLNETFDGWENGVGPVVPSINIEATFRNAAKSIRKGSIAQQSSAIAIKPDYIPIDFDGKGKSVQELYDDPNRRYADFRIGRIKGASVTLNRPRFDNWSLTFTIYYDDTKFNRDEIINLFEIAGRDVGTCDFRAKFGHFAILETK
jgi:hypothetical protein